MKISSSAFTEGSPIPRKYTCDGENVSPPLAWADLPPGTKALALIVDDPDASSGAFAHWVAFNLPADSPGLPEAVPPGQAAVAGGGTQGINSFRKMGYGGPCPPSGTHRYFFKLYALDTPLNLSTNATAQDVERVAQSHILARAQLMGRYQRQK